MDSALGEIPGIDFEFTAPMRMRLGEVISGVKTDLGVKLFGDSLSILEAKGEEVRDIIAVIPGAEDVLAQGQRRRVAARARRRSRGDRPLRSHGVGCAAGGGAGRTRHACLVCHLGTTPVSDRGPAGYSLPVDPGSGGTDSARDAGRRNGDALAGRETPRGRRPRGDRPRKRRAVRAGPGQRARPRPGRASPAKWTEPFARG